MMELFSFDVTSVIIKSSLQSTLLKASQISGSTKAMFISLPFTATSLYTAKEDT